MERPQLKIERKRERVCVCVCVCERERALWKGRMMGKGGGSRAAGVEKCGGKSLIVGWAAVTTTRADQT